MWLEREKIAKVSCILLRCGGVHGKYESRNFGIKITTHLLGTTKTCEGGK